MKAPTDKNKQWLWFAALWSGGLMTAFFLSYLVRFLISNT